MPDRAATPGQSLSIEGCPFFISNRQREVLRLAALGQTDRAIALKLAITPRTVRAHLQAARETLGALNTTHAVAIALTRQLIQLNTITACRPERAAGPQAVN